jgi:L-threonylcarbamoyladenylate synthase
MDDTKRLMDEDIRDACEVMRKGGLILYPTDTVWGLGCDATNEEAVHKCYTLKNRIDNKAMLVLTDSQAKLYQYVDTIPDIAWDLMSAAEKPLTIIYPKAKNLAPNLLAPDGSVGIRVTKEDFSRRLCEAFRKPIVSTSANVSGEPSPAIFSDISETIKNGVDFIVRYRRDDENRSTPSNIIFLGEGGLVRVIR